MLNVIFIQILVTSTFHFVILLQSPISEKLSTFGLALDNKNCETQTSNKSKINRSDLCYAQHLECAGSASTRPADPLMGSREAADLVSVLFM